MTMEENMNKVFFIFMIIGVPLSIIGSIFNWNYILMFFIYCVTLISLANYIRRSTESLSVVVYPTAGDYLMLRLATLQKLLFRFCIK